MDDVELLNLCTQATPGPWDWFGGGPVSKPEVDIAADPYDGITDNHEAWSRNGRYIAACSPEVVRGLVERAQQAEAEAERLAHDRATTVAALRERLTRKDELIALIAEARRGGGPDEYMQDLDALPAEVAAMHAELVETWERLSLAEAALAGAHRRLAAFGRVASGGDAQNGAPA